MPSLSKKLESTKLTMPPRSSSDRSPISVMRWSDDYSSCSSTTSAGRNGGKDKKQPLVKSLRFNDKLNEVFEITHLDDIPEDEVAATWYDSNEYAEIKANYQLTIFMMESGEKLNADHTPRGLEYRTQEGAWARYENKRDAYNAVLDEQDRQWARDADDEEEIARIYLEHSSKCAMAAAERAKNDEKEAFEILKTIMPPRRRQKSDPNFLKKQKEKAEREKAKRRGAAEGVDKARELLQERSRDRRSEVRDDIKKFEKKTTMIKPAGVDRTVAL